MTRKDGKLLGPSAWTLTIAASIAITLLSLLGFPETTSGSFRHTPRAEVIWVGSGGQPASDAADESDERRSRPKTRARSMFATLLLLSDRAAIGPR